MSEINSKGFEESTEETQANIDKDISDLLGDEIFDIVIENVENRENFLELIKKNGDIVNEIEENLEEDIISGDLIIDGDIFGQIYEKYKLLNKEKGNVENPEGLINSNIYQELDENGISLSNIKQKELKEKSTLLNNEQNIEENISNKLENDTNKLENDTKELENDTKELENDTKELNDDEIKRIENVNKIEELIGEIEIKLGVDNIKELFTDKEIERAEREFSYLGKNDPKYDLYVKSYLLTNFVKPEFSDLQGDIDKLKSLFKKDDRFKEYPKSSRDYILASDTFKGGNTLRKGNFYIDGDQLYRIDDKTGKVNKFIYSEGSDFMLETTVEMPTDYEYRRSKKKIQKEYEKVGKNYSDNFDIYSDINKDLEEKYKELEELKEKLKNGEGSELEIDLLISEIENLEKENQIYKSKLESIKEEIDKIKEKAKRIEMLERDRISDFKKVQEQIDKQARETLAFLRSIGFDLINQGTTNQVIEMLNSNDGLRKSLGFDGQIDLANGNLGLQKDNDLSKIGNKEKTIFAEFTNIMISGEKGKPINIGNIKSGSGVGISDKSSFKVNISEGINSSNGNIIAMQNIGDFVNNKFVEEDKKKEKNNTQELPGKEDLISYEN